MKEIKGVYTALVTPFCPNGRLDEAGLKHNIRYQLDQGIDGLVVLGTTGEYPTLTEQEKVRIISIVREQNTVPVMVGTGSYSTEQTIHNTLQAEDLGADFALVVTPYYNKPTQEGLWYHFHAVATAVSLPIVIYHIPSRCGCQLSTPVLQRLAQIPNIVGIKEASGNFSLLSEMSSYPFSILAGDDAATLPFIALGGRGVVSVASNLIPKEVKQLTTQSLLGNFSAAREWHRLLFPLFQALFIETNPIPIKAAMQEWGMPAGKCRLPLCELIPENREKLLHCLKTFESIAV